MKQTFYLIKNKLLQKLCIKINIILLISDFFLHNHFLSDYICIIFPTQLLSCTYKILLNVMKFV